MSNRDKAWETTINEVFTHLTALSSGSIVILAALGDELDVSGWARGAAILATVGFVVAIGAGVGAKLAVAKLTARANEDQRYESIEGVMVNLGSACLVAFAVALLCLGALAIRSFLT